MQSLLRVSSDFEKYAEAVVALRDGLRRLEVDPGSAALASQAHARWLVDAENQDLAGAIRFTSSLAALEVAHRHHLETRRPAESLWRLLEDVPASPARTRGRLALFSESLRRDQNALARTLFDRLRSEGMTELSQWGQLFSEVHEEATRLRGRACTRQQAATQLEFLNLLIGNENPLPDEAEDADLLRQARASCLAAVGRSGEAINLARSLVDRQCGRWTTCRMVRRTGLVSRGRTGG